MPSGMVPDEIIKAGADQFECAQKRLLEQNSKKGLNLPAINAASIAIELYLKSLNALGEYTSYRDPSGIRPLWAQAKRGHDPNKLLQDQPADLQRAIEEEFSSRAPFGETLEDVLTKLRGMFQASLYIFEVGNEVFRYDIDALMSLSAFLCNFVDDYEGYAWWTKT